jgi:hypothetical protein
VFHAYKNNSKIKKEAIMSSLLEIKFWNKRSSASNFMITAPHTLDNYFRSQLSRIRGGHLPVPIEFNNVVNNV